MLRTWRVQQYILPACRSLHLSSRKNAMDERQAQNLINSYLVTGEERTEIIKLLDSTGKSLGPNINKLQALNMASDKGLKLVRIDMEQFKKQTNVKSMPIYQLLTAEEAVKVKQRLQDEKKKEKEEAAFLKEKDMN